MTTVLPRTPAASLASTWSRLRRCERICYLIGGALVASGAVHFGVFLVRGGGWDGPLSWRKPTTFGISFGLTLITVTWVTSYLTMPVRRRSWLLGVFAADCVIEVAGITVQAWRRVPSHFNTETPASTVVAMSLAFGGAVLIIVLGAFAVAAFRGRIDAEPDMRRALRAGFGFLVLGLATGAAMIAKGEILIRTGHRQEAYDTAGSLKWVHGVTLHAILVLPAISAVLAMRGRPLAKRLRAVTVGTWAYAVATAAALLLSLLAG